MLWNNVSTVWNCYNYNLDVNKQHTDKNCKLRKKLTREKYLDEKDPTVLWNVIRS